MRAGGFAMLVVFGIRCCFIVEVGGVDDYMLAVLACVDVYMLIEREEEEEREESRGRED